MKRQGSVVVIALVLVLCVSITGAEENNSDKYTLESYGGEEFTPQPLEFGENIKYQDKDESLSISKNERKHVLLQFYANPNKEQRQLLQDRGVQFLEGVAPYTVLVSMPADMTPADLPAESGLRWMGPIPVENKYDKNYRQNVPAWARTENGEVKLAVFFYEDVDSQDAINILKKYSHNYSASSNLRPWYYETIINETNITSIVSEDAVYNSGYYGFETIPTEGSDFVDYVENTEEDIGDSMLVDEQETSLDTEKDSDKDVEKAPGFQSVFGFLFLIIAFLFLAGRKSYDR